MIVVSFPVSSCCVCVQALAYSSVSYTTPLCLADLLGQRGSDLLLLLGSDPLDFSCKLGLAVVGNG